MVINVHERLEKWCSKSSAHFVDYYINLKILDGKINHVWILRKWNIIALIYIQSLVLHLSARMLQNPDNILKKEKLDEFSFLRSKILLFY